MVYNSIDGNAILWGGEDTANALEQRPRPDGRVQLSLDRAAARLLHHPPRLRRHGHATVVARIDFTPAGAPVASGYRRHGRRLQRERGLRLNVTTAPFARRATPISASTPFAWVDNTSTRAWRYDLPDATTS